MTSPHDQLRLEAAAIAWVEGGDADRELSQELRAACAEPCELHYLLRAMGYPFEGPRPEPPTFVVGQPIRAGYRLVAETGKEPEILPVFAQALASCLARDQLVRLFGHLWGVDLELWRALPTATPAELALRWLTSPGRRLVRDPKILVAMRRGSERADATNLRPQTIWAASGATLDFSDSGPGLERWLDLHRSIPGKLMTAWQPKRRERAITTALARLERGSPHTLRGAALGWLLNHAVDHPHIEIDGVHQDLREALPAHLALALQPDESTEDFSALLEEQILQHAALISANEAKPGSIMRAWHLARWIHGCLARSPFTPGGEESLHAEIVALLPVERAVVDPDDPLHPARFGAHGLRIEDVALVAGAWVHYDRDGEFLLPPPLPLVNAMRRLAARCVTPGELDAECSLARGHSNELGWTAPHIAPPWVARWLLTQWRVPWLGKLPSETVDECLRSLQTDPRFHWLAHVYRTEGSQLDDAQQQLAHEVWRNLAEQPETRHELLASMGIGLLTRLDERDRSVARDAIDGSPATWQPFLLDAWADAAFAVDRMDLAQPAFDGLLDLTRAPELTAEIRLNAALLLLRRAAQARSTPEGMDILQQLAALAKQSPFRDHAGLLRELRRLGVASPSAS